MRRKTAALLLSIVGFIWLPGHAGEPAPPPLSASTAPSMPPPPWLSVPQGEQNITQISKAPAVYPKEAMEHGHQGATIVRLTIDSKGKIVAVSVGRSSGFPELDGAAVNAAWTWEFRPGWLHGVATGGVIEVPVVFALSVVEPKQASSTAQPRN